MMRRLFSFASAWNRSSRKSSRGRGRSRRYTPGSYSATARVHLAMEPLETRIALATTAPVLMPNADLFLGENFDPLGGGNGQLIPFLATITQSVDSGHLPDDFNQVFPLYSVTIDWDTTDPMNALDTGVTAFLKWERTATGYDYTARVEASHLYAVAGEYSVKMWVDDGLGHVVDDTFTIDVYPLTNTTELDMDPVSSGDVDEGSSYGLILSSNLPTSQYKINWGDGAITGASGSSGNPTTVQHTYVDDLLGSSYQVYGAVSEFGNDWKFNVGPIVNVLDVLPIGAISGNATVAAGDTYTLNLSTFDPGDDVVVNWFIDWNYNEMFPNPNFPDDFYDGITSATHVYDTPNTYKIYAEGTDSDGNPVFANVLTVTVTGEAEEPPIADAGGPYTTLADVPITLIGSGSGGAGNYTFAWDLDGDDEFGEAGEVGASVTFNPAGVPGVQTVKLKVTDENDVVSEIVETTINVQATGAVLVDNTLHVAGSSTGSDNVSVTVSGGNVIVTANSVSQSFSLSEIAELNVRTGGGDDVIQIAAPSSIPVFIDTGDGNDSVSVVSASSGPGPLLFSLSSTPELNIHTGDGNDIIQIAAAVTVPTTVDAGDGNDLIIGGNGRSVLMGGAGTDIIYGGAGDDVLLGGTGNDLILGGAGNDVLVGGGGVDILEGGAGRDLIVGGIGNDVLLGGDGEDILIGGRTNHDGNVAALDAIMAVWSGAGSFTNRINALTTGTGLLRLNVDVFDDDSIDVITGGSGADLIIADRSLLGDLAIDLVLLQSAQDRLIALN